jgi:hypothetical protein
VHDFNVLERRAKELITSGRPKDAMAIYPFMGDGDPSYDAGYLAAPIRECCEQLDDPHAAKWWYGRAVEENPAIPAYTQVRQRLEHITIERLILPRD